MKSFRSFVFTLVLLAQVVFGALPLDFYFVVDRSGSINDNDKNCKLLNNGLTCMQVLTDFANKTAHAMHELVGRWFENKEDNGVRIGILLFRCPGQAPPGVDPQSPDILLEPTGNYTEILRGMNRLFQVGPNGNTCARTALKGVVNYVKESALNPLLTPPNRTTSVLYLTDGLLESGDRPLSYGNATTLRDMGVGIFGVSIGTAANQIKEIKQITGSEERIWNVNDVNGLDGVISSLTSFIFGDFRIQLYGDKKASDICQGELPVMSVTGASTSNFSNAECAFELEGLPNKVFVQEAKQVQSGLWTCNAPDSFFTSPQGEKMGVVVYSFDNGVRRQVGIPFNVTLGRQACVTTTFPSPDRCLGTSSSFVFSGTTVTSYLAPPQSEFQYDPICEVDYSGTAGYQGVVRSVSGSKTCDANGSACIVQCTFADPSADVYAASTFSEPIQVMDGSNSVQLKRVSPPIITGLKLRMRIQSGTANIPGTSVKTQDIIVLSGFAPPNVTLSDPSCVASEVDSSACFRTQAKASFRGATVSAMASKSQLACLVQPDPGMFYLMPVAVDPGGSVSCALPEKLLEPRVDGSLTWPIKSELYAYNAAQKMLLPLSRQLNESSFTLNPCMAVSQPAATCFGERATVNVISQSGLSLSTSPGISCTFIDVENNVTLSGSWTSLGSNSFACSTPDLTGDLFGLTMTQFFLLSNGIPLVRFSLNENDNVCFSAATNSMQEPGTFSAVPKALLEFDLDFCWGSSGAAKVLFTGRTPSALRAENVTCRYFGDASNVTAVQANKFVEVPAEFSEGSGGAGGFVCTAPDELFSGLGGNVLPGLVVTVLVYPHSAPSRRLFSSTLRFASRVTSPCFSTLLAKVGASSDMPVCVGDSVEGRIEQQSSSSLPQLVQFNNNECEVSAGGKQIRTPCSVTNEGNIRFDVQDTLALLGTDSTVTVFGRVRLPLPRLAALDSSTECWSPVLNVDPQVGPARRRSVQTSSDSTTYCLGDGLSASIQGKTVNFVVANYPSAGLRCVWTPKDLGFAAQPSETTTTPRVETTANGTVLVCESPKWDPFSPQGITAGVYASVSVVIEMQDGTYQTLGQPVLLEDDFAPQVCSNIGFGETPKADADCSRDAVTLALSGRTAYALSKPPQGIVLGCFSNNAPLQCEAVAANGTVLEMLPNVNDQEISCPVQGWSPDQPGSGNYTEVRLSSCLTDGSTRVVKKEVFQPTAARVCLSLGSEPALPCYGETVQGQVTGTSLSAYVRYIAAQGISLQDVRIRDTTSKKELPLGTNASVATAFRAVLAEHFMPGTASDSAALNLEVVLGSSPLAPVPLPLRDLRMAKEKPASDRCASFQDGLYSCSGPTRGTTVTVDGVVPELLNAASLPGKLSCEFSNSSQPGKVSYGLPQKVNETRISCTSTEPYDSVTLLYGDQLRTLLSAPVLLAADSGTCALAVAPTVPGELPGAATAAIVGGVLGGLLLLLVAALIVARRRSKDGTKEDAEKKAPPPPNADLESPVENLALNDVSLDIPTNRSGLYQEGSRVEVRGQYDPALSEETWFKATVHLDFANGSYQVSLDHLAESGNSLVVAQGDHIRAISTDFAIHQHVEARLGKGKAWHTGCVVARVMPNDEYQVEFHDGSDGSEILPGTFLRTPKMLYGPNKHVVIRSLGQRACIKSVDATAETYAVALRATGDTKKVSCSDILPFSPQVGDVVDVSNPTSGLQHRAVISEVLADSESCQVTYEDLASRGEPTLVSWDLMDRVAFKEGEKVIVRQDQQQGKFTDATIASVDSLGTTCTVMYTAEGTTEADVDVGRIRKSGQHPRIPNGTAVLARLGENWHRARVVSSAALYDVVLESGPKKGEQLVQLSPLYIKDLPVDFVDPTELNEQEPDSSPFGTVFRPPPRDHPQASDNDGLRVPYHLRFKKRKPLQFAELSNNQFEVALDMSEGLGLSLGWTNDHRVIVAGFRDLPNGDWGPVEACGLVGLKDQLVKVNGASIGGKSFVEVSELIKNSGKTIRLQFGRSDGDASLAGVASGMARAS